MASEREEFEGWARESGLALYLAHEHGRGYLDADTWKAFAAWCAGRKAGARAAREQAAQWMQQHDAHFVDDQISYSSYREAIAKTMKYLDDQLRALRLEGED